MLVTSVISIGNKFRTTVLTQRLCTLIKMYSTSTGSSSGSSSESSSGSSSDSSDSDSDAENLKKTEPVENASATSLDNLVDNLISLKDKKRIDVAMPVRKIIKQDKPSPKKNVSHETQLSQAVCDITNNLSKNKEEIKTQLLDRLSTMYEDSSKKNDRGSLSTNIENIVLNHKSSSSQKNEDINNNDQWKYKADIARKLKAHNRSEQQEKKEEPSHIKELLKNERRKKYKVEIKQMKERKFEANESKRKIFEEIKEPTTTIPELSTWVFLEKRELDLIANQSPKNIFQEMIQWTESGKLWKFPINNEIGMEKESDVHFTEHVFLERHLKDWCPTSGPIRHFMELVCVGLSKNPYMTVTEKTDHIAWYKEYFKEKKEILLELGAIQEKSDTTKEITS